MAELKITVRNAKALEDLHARLLETTREMAAINPNFTPIRFETKARWQSVVEEATEFFGRFVQPQETSAA
jgi:hypothetical protein